MVQRLFNHTLRTLLPGNRRQLIQLLIMWGLAVIAALLAPFIASNRQLWQAFLAVFFGLAAVLILLRWPIVGIIGIIVANLAVYFSISTGTETGINAGVMLLLLMIFLWILDMISRKHKITLLPSRTVMAALVFCISAVISFGFGQFSWFPTQSAPLPAQIGGLMIYLLSAAAFLLIAHQLNTVRELRWMTWTFLTVAGIYIVLRLVPWVVSERQIYQVFVMRATLGCLFYVWLGALATSQALFNTQLDRRWRAAIGALALAAFYLNMGAGRFWVSGWLPMLVGVAVVIIIARPRFGVPVILCGIFFLLINTQVVSGLTSEGDNAYSIESRLAAWRILAEIIRANPFFGLGMANYYWYTPLFDILGYFIKFNSHNNYIDMIAQSGLIGLACFIWWMWEVFRLGWRLRIQTPEGFPRAFVYGALGGLAGTVFAGLLGDWVIPFVYNIGLEGFRATVLAFMFLGGLLVLEKLFVTTDAFQASNESK